ncbi:lysophospholipid acyltransferase family protein [Arenibacterium halophilum]|uniref:1-acyl-sn-glycerol-3-phosphate acyltransferase n=1 Tax=Arenibacterium halophilum TaxID=2583821 RepID=A0ABY2XAR4_9RHOB|nr:lysophospholipid acyltransferase family protein [Arenibacterium halophilum]TMV13455.1 1-acyl-sn-glycerol-3-phosphate acyltransferase [Arenibacterium halophilum]
MSPLWNAAPEPDVAPISPLGWLRVAWRGLILGTVVFGGLAILLTLRLIERPLFGARRPLTPWITQWVCRAAFFILGIGFSSKGQLMPMPGAVVANHSSWLDIFALNARKRVYFVSKAEVAGWPGIGWLARATGTVFIQRDRRHARAQTDLFRTRLRAGHRLLFFPEGTSTDGRRVLPFKTTLFAAFLSDLNIDDLHVQPCCVIYNAPPREDSRFYGWWGDMAFGPHLLQTLAARRQGAVQVIYLPPLRVADFSDRKALAAAAEAAVRAAHPQGDLRD